jgi:flavin-dependent dehydrogenase
MKVLIVDRSEFPRTKACGDAVGAPAEDLLRSLGVDTKVVFAGSHRTPQLQLRHDTSLIAERPISRPPFVLPRRDLDARLLASAIAAGAVFRVERVRDVSEFVGGWRVDGEAGRVVIGADGSESIVRNSIRKVGRNRWAVAIRGYADTTQEFERHVIAMTGRGWPSYGWVFPMGAHVNVGFGTLVTATAKPSRAALLGEIDRLFPALGSPLRDVRAARLPLSRGGVRVGDGRLLLAGDALRLVNPVTGEGIFQAMLSGALAGRAASREADPGMGYRRTLRAAITRHHRHLALMRPLGRWPRLAEAVLERAARSPVVFEGFAEMGMAGGALTAPMIREFLVPQTPWHEPTETAEL